MTNTQENITYKKAKRSVLSQQATTRLQGMTRNTNTKIPQKKYRLGTVSKKITGGLKHIWRYQPHPYFWYGSRRILLDVKMARMVHCIYWGFIGFNFQNQSGLYFFLWRPILSSEKCRTWWNTIRLGLHCLPKYSLGVYCLQRIKIILYNRYNSFFREYASLLRKS